jgi:hypothetical protein
MAKDESIDKVLESFGEKLFNYEKGIVKSCSANLLNRLEDYCIY